MEEEKKENSICDIACACIHSALIAGDEDCMYGEDEDVEFWNGLAEDHDVICVLGTVEVNGSRFFNRNGESLEGTFFRVLAIITPNEIEDFDKLFKEEMFWQITDGYYYYGGCGLRASIESCCPIRIDKFELHFSIDNYMTYRTDNHLKINKMSQRTCEICGKVYYYEDGVYTEDERELCHECYADGYTMCDICDKETLCENTMSSYEYSHICEDCAEEFVECHECGEIHHIDYTTFLEDEEIDLCSGCYEDLATWCDRCSRSVLKENAVSMIAEGSDRPLDYCKECAGTIKLRQMGLERWKI